MKIWAEVSGIEAANALVDGKFGAVRGGLTDALLGGGKIFEEGCREHCPVDTGTMRDSHDTVAVSDDEVHVGPHTDYAIHVHFGTYKMSPNPWMRFGYETKRSEVITYIQSKLAALIA
jgi:HK97 gp10 family phage protein